MVLTLGADCCYVFNIIIHTRPFDAISSTASAGVSDWYCSLQPYWLSLDKSTHSLMSFVPFFGVMTIDAHHSVTSVTGAIISCCRSS